VAQQSNGSIKYVNPAKRFGFIAPSIAGKPDVFFSFDQMRGNAARLPQRGEKIVYEEGIGKRGPVATTLYNLSDPLACEDYQADIETSKRLQATQQNAHEGRKAFTLSLYEKNRLWRERAAANAAAKKA
jgi:cold shock CspA family protein